ncbi:hypothetical protein J5N97_015045 [Dioscorea zingiberensis]|uniref:Protein MIZU-KUSSEI 1 n=1 Tax=Dioscorea zingiberensis TaxID=325984 RepID=A0A9D5CTX5_9LILI|nr:hypothetical protein J5N97_015045 [Dioscorea zingiberensis]
MKLIDNLRRSIACCFIARSPDTVAITTTRTSVGKRPSCASLVDIFKDRPQEDSPRQQENQEEEEDSLIDAAAASCHHPPSPCRSLVVGTLFGHRRGHVCFCVQSDPAVPPPFLFEISVPTAFLAREMSSGLLRVSLECTSASRRSNRCDQSGPVWKAYCNGRKVGYAVRRRPCEKDLVVVQSLRSVSAGAGVMPENVRTGQGEVMYVRASYERVVGSRDSVSYHLINPGGSPSQELSVFLLRNRHK